MIKIKTDQEGVVVTPSDLKVGDVLVRHCSEKFGASDFTGIDEITITGRKNKEVLFTNIPRKPDQQMGRSNLKFLTIIGSLAYFTLITKEITYEIF